MQPRALRRPADGEAAGRPAGDDAAGAAAAAIDTEAWVWLCEEAGQRLFWPPNVSGWDDNRWLDTSRMRARWNMVTYALEEVSVDAWNDDYSTTETPEEALARRRRRLGLARAARRAPRRAARLRRPQRETDRRQLAEGPLPGAAPERPAAADRRQPGHDPAMSPRPQHHSCCNGYTRSQLLRSAAAEAGKGLPAIEPGMPEPAGTGLSRRKFLSRSAGLALAVYGASKIPLSAFETGIAQAAQGDKILVSVFFDGGIDALSVLAPVGDSRYAQLRPNLALPPGAGDDLQPRTRACSGTPRPRRSRPCTARARSAPSRRSATTTPTSPTSPPATTTRSASSQVGYRTGWLGRYLDAVGDDENPLQGLSLDGSLSPMIATAEKPVAAIDSVDGYDLWSRVGDPIEAEMFRSFARFGSLPADSPGLAQVRRAASQTDKLRQDLAGVGDFTSPVAYPDNWFAHKLAGLAAYIAVGLPMRVVTIRAPGGYDTHADQAADLEDNLRETCDGILAFQRDLEARGLADRVLIEMWSEFGRRPEENGSLGTDHGAAGCAFVIGSQSQRRDGRRVPRPGHPRRGRQPAGDQRLPRDVLLAARAVARIRRRSDHPRRLGFARPVLVKP